MPEFERIGDLEIAHHDLRFQRRSWTAERLGRAVLVVVVLLALLGLFGGGALSDAVERDPSTGLRVSYERFLRLGRPDTLSIEVGERAGGAPLSVSLPAAYLERFEPASITPQPETETISGGTVTYAFAAGTRQVSLLLEPSALGLQRAQVRSGGVVELEQMVWP